MQKKDLLRQRLFRLILIAAWIALGTVMVVMRGDWWVWFAAVSYVIAIFYIVAEVLIWRKAMRQKSGPVNQVDGGPPSAGDQSSNPG